MNEKISLTVEQAQEAKRELEKNIKILIQDFSNSLDVKVTDIEISSTPYPIGDRGVIVVKNSYKVKITAEL